MKNITYNEMEDINIKYELDRETTTNKVEKICRNICYMEKYYLHLLYFFYFVSIGERR